MWYARMLMRDDSGTVPIWRLTTGRPDPDALCRSREAVLARLRARVRVVELGVDELPEGVTDIRPQIDLVDSLEIDGVFACVHARGEVHYITILSTGWE